MLAALPCVHVQLGYAGEKVTRFSPHAEAVEQFDVKSDACLEDSGCGSGFAGVGPAKLQRGILFEIPETSTCTHPW